MNSGRSTISILLALLTLTVTWPASAAGAGKQTAPPGKPVAVAASSLIEHFVDGLDRCLARPGADCNRALAPWVPKQDAKDRKRWFDEFRRLGVSTFEAYAWTAHLVVPLEGGSSWRLRITGSASPDRPRLVQIEAVVLRTPHAPKPPKSRSDAFHLARPLQRWLSALAGEEMEVQTTFPHLEAFFVAHGQRELGPEIVLEPTEKWEKTIGLLPLLATVLRTGTFSMSKFTLHTVGLGSASVTGIPVVALPWFCSQLQTDSTTWFRRSGPGRGAR